VKSCKGDSIGVRLSKMEAFSDIGADVALPGKSVNIKVTLNGAGKTRVSFYVNDELIKQKDITVYQSRESLVSTFW